MFTSYTSDLGCSTLGGLVNLSPRTINKPCSLDCMLFQWAPKRTLFRTGKTISSKFSFAKFWKNKKTQNYSKILLNIFLMNSHTLEFHSHLLDIRVT